MKIKKNVSLKPFSTFGIGGLSKLFTEVSSYEEMRSALLYCKERCLRYFILGKGSNSLFDDRGFDGMVILNKIEFFKEPEPSIFYVGSGFSFSYLGIKTAKKGYSGLEFASGIPGSVGGAVYMNAGASGKETSASLMSVDYLKDNQIVTFLKNDIEFSYRFSSFQTMKGVILAAAFKLQKSETARKDQIEIVNYRTKTQPYGQYSAGCVFRNAEKETAGALIDRCGLKNLTVGGAKVSSAHANFIVNVSGATAKDVLELIEIIREEVRKKTKISLECEVNYIPYQGKDDGHI